ncbi:MAG: DNA polymerase III subunit gamma/tau, partial [Anaerolineales bacterium]
MAQTLYRKWRPKQWEEVIGQEHIIQTLRNAVANERFAHAFLFSGPRGTGKTTTARLLAKAVNCLSDDPAGRPCEQCENCVAINHSRFIDLIEIDAASNTGVDDVRELRDKINFAPSQGRYKVYIIDEVHMLSTAAFNALLKTLEEPPPHAIFILATTEVQKIPATVLSRCQRHEFRRIPLVDIVAQLEKITIQEGWEYEKAALQVIARQATGSLRDAISLLDQLASSGKGITLEWVRQLLGIGSDQMVIELIDALVASQSPQGLEIIHQVLDRGSDSRVFARQIVDYLRNVLLTKMGNASEVDAPLDNRSKMAQHAMAFSVEQILAVIRCFNQAINESRNTWIPALPLEMSFLEAGLALTPPKNSTESSPQQSPHPNQPTKVSDLPTKELAIESHLEESTSQANEITLEQVRNHWREIRTQVRQQNPNIEALLNSCKPIDIKNGKLYLGFNGEFAKEKMERPEILALVSKISSQILGKPVQIYCLLNGPKRGE